MIQTMILISLLIATSPVHVFANDLAEIRDKTFVLVMNNFEIIAKQDNIESSAYVIRIIRVRDNGECDGTPESCPKEQLYIAVSSYGEYPDQKLYMLPKTYGWKFVRWITLPTKEDPDHFATFEILKQMPSKDPKKDWWTTKKYKVSVNTEKGFIDVVK